MANYIDFTILTSDTPSGFTDQLFQFSTFYKLGQSLAYDYRHTEFDSPRSTSGIYDFLGFNDYFRDKGLLCDTTSYRQVLKIGLDDSLIQSIGIKSFEDLKAHVANQFKRTTGTEIILVQFQLTGKRKFFDLVNNHIPNLDGLNLRTIYFSARTKKPHDPIFESGKIRVLVHIRQGDTAIINTPWGTHIPVTKHRYPKLREFHDLKDLGNPHDKVSVGEFYRATRELISFFTGNSLSVVVSSDGFHRAFERIYKEGEASGISTHQLSSLKTVEREYEDQYLQFNDLENTECIVGETEGNLYRLVHASMFADIIVIGTQQRMMQKLLMNFHDPNSPPVVIKLNNFPASRLDNQASSDTLYSRVIPANLKDDYALTAVFRKVAHKINLRRIDEKKS